LPINTDAGSRNIFLTHAQAPTNLVNLRDNENVSALTDKNDYFFSHQFIENNQEISFILYPSYRDPHQRDNAAVLDIHHLEQTPRWEKDIKYFYNNKTAQLLWIDYDLRINWTEVS